MTDPNEQIETTNETPNDDVVMRLDELERTQSSLSSILSDSDVQKVLAAKDKGESVRIVTGNETETETDLSLQGDPEEMSNSELVKYMGKRVERIVENALKPVASRVEGVEGHLGEKEAERLSQEVAQCKENHPDFDKHKSTMAKLREHNPGLSIEELYTIAKVRSKTNEKEDKKKASTADPGSERPSTAIAEPRQNKDFSVNKPDTATKKRSFNDILSEGVDKVAEELGL